MKKYINYCLFFILALYGNTVLAQQTFYASPNGSGSDCTLECPCSLEGVRNKVRTVNNNMTGDIVVKLMPGVYTRYLALDLDSRDSGSNGFNVIYESNDTSNPAIFSGGLLISGWTIHDVSKNIYKASIGSSEFRQLYVNGTMATRARTPNATDNKTFGPYLKGSISVDLTDNTIKIPDGQVNNWDKMNQVELVMKPHWYDLHLRIGSYTKDGPWAKIMPMEPERNICFNKTTSFFNNSSFYYFENAYEFLDAKGEWYLNTDNDTVYYKPRFNEDMASAEVIVPNDVETLMAITGTPTTPAHHLQIHGISFEYTTWMEPGSNGTGMDQGNQILSGLSTYKVPPPALKVEYANNIRLERNIFSKLGGIGVDLYRGVNNSQVVGNVFYDIAGNGLVLDIKDGPNPSSANQLTNILVANNFITRVGRNYSNAQGILAGFVKNITIEHNEISDIGYIGMQIGQQSGGNVDVGMENNKIQYNDVHNVMQQHDDGGGIYTLARQPGTHIFENWIHDITKGPWASTYTVNGVYNDNRSEFITIERNVIDIVENVETNTVKIYQQTKKGAQNNTYLNNDIQDQSVRDNAGLELPYKTIKNVVRPLPSGPPLPSFSESKVEIENMILTGATVEKATIYSNGEGVKLNTLGGNIGEASFIFSGISGAYDITVAYIKEKIGRALYKLYVNGAEVDSWTAAVATSAYEFTTRKSEFVTLNNGDVLKITSTAIGESFGRMDYVELLKIDAPLDVNEKLAAYPELLVYPNPVHDYVIFSFSLLHESRVILSIFDMLGNVVKRIDQVFINGNSLIQINIKNDFVSLYKGLYIYRFETKEFTKIGKLLL